MVRALSLKCKKLKNKERKKKSTHTKIKYRH